MDFVANGKMQESGQKWAKGLEPNPVQGVEVTAFEKKTAELGLKPDQYAASKELKQWCVSGIDGSPRYDVLYVPEALLKMWSIRTAWDGDEIAEDGLAEVMPFSDMVSTDYEFSGKK